MGWCGKARGLKFVTLRYFNVAGAAPDGSIGEDHSPETHLIPLVLKSALPGGRPLSVYGDDYPTPDGTCIRDYIHVCDLADAHIKALSHLLSGGESDVFNLGNGEGFSVLEIIEAARLVTGRELPARVATRRPGDPARLVACADKAKRVLGWEPRHTEVKEIIADAWRWHSAMPGGYGARG